MFSCSQLFKSCLQAQISTLDIMLWRLNIWKKLFCTTVLFCLTIIKISLFFKTPLIYNFFIGKLHTHPRRGDAVSVQEYTRLNILTYRILYVKSPVCMISCAGFPLKTVTHKERISKTWSSSSCWDKISTITYIYLFSSYTKRKNKEMTMYLLWHGSQQWW